MTKMKQVLPEDFNVDVLMTAAREGRLFIDVSVNAVSKEKVVNEVRAYVERINKFATSKARSSISDIWDTILSYDEFVEYLMPSNKARKCRDFNKYHLMGIIGVLREKGVYKQYNDRKYDALLEPGIKDSTYRKYLSLGIGQREVLLKLRKIVEKYNF